MSQWESATREKPKGQPTNERTRGEGPQTSPPLISGPHHKKCPLKAEPGNRDQHEVAQILHAPSCIYETDCLGPMPLRIKALINFMLPRSQAPRVHSSPSPTARSRCKRGTPSISPIGRKTPADPSSTPCNTRNPRASDNTPKSAH